MTEDKDQSIWGGLQIPNPNILKRLLIYIRGSLKPVLQIVGKDPWKLSVFLFFSFALQNVPCEFTGHLWRCVRRIVYFQKRKGLPSRKTSCFRKAPRDPKRFPSEMRHHSQCMADYCFAGTVRFTSLVLRKPSALDTSKLLELRRLNSGEQNLRWVYSRERNPDKKEKECYKAFMHMKTQLLGSVDLKGRRKKGLIAWV